MVDDDLMCAEEGTATPAHTDRPTDTRLLDAMDRLKASLEYDARGRRWLVTTDRDHGYKDAYFGNPDRPLRAVLMGWLLREDDQ